MFLTGQFYPRPWEEPKKPKEQPKDKNYFNNKDGLWNNPHRTGKKVATFYHQKDQTFKKTHFTDQEIKNIQSKEQDLEKFQLSQEKRFQSRERLTNRKAEREILQFKSNQHLEEDDVDQVGDLAVQEPELFDEMATKRAKSYKDPAKQKQPNMQLWNAINQLPSKQLSKILRPNIIEKDKNAAELIHAKIQQQKFNEEIQNQWFVQNRQETRQKFIERHEKNIQLEKKAGIPKEYQPIIPQNKEALKMNQGSGVSLPNRPFSAYNAQISLNSSKKGIQRISNLLAQNQKQQQSEGQVTFRQKDQNLVSQLEEDQNIHIQDDDQQNNLKSQAILDSHSATNYQNYISTQNFNGKSSQGKFSTSKSRTDNQNGKQLEFRVSTSIQPVFYRSNKTFDKLNQAKKPFEPNKPFMHSDFRGLFTADHQEALVNCNEYDPEKHSTYISIQNAGGKKNFNTVRELFPMPQGKPQNLLFASNQGILTSSKTFINPYQNRSRQQFSSTRQGTPFSDQADYQIGVSIQNIKLNDSPSLNTDPHSRLKLNHNQMSIEQNTEPQKIIAQSALNMGGAQKSEGGNQTPYIEARQLRSSQTVGQSRLIKRPLTAYRETFSQRGGFNRNKKVFGNATPSDPYQGQEQNASFSSHQQTKMQSSRQRQKLQYNLLQAQQQLENEKEESLSQMDWFERANHLEVQRKNRYPQIAYQEALNYDEVFLEHLAKKKQQNSPKNENGTTKLDNSSSNSKQVNQKSNITLNKSQNSIRLIATPSALSENI